MNSEDKAGTMIILGIFGTFVLLPVLLLGGVFLEENMKNNFTLEMKKIEVEKAKWEATTRPASPAITPVAPMVVEKN